MLPCHFRFDADSFCPLLPPVLPWVYITEIGTGIQENNNDQIHHLKMWLIFQFRLVTITLLKNGVCLVGLWYRYVSFCMCTLLYAGCVPFVQRKFRCEDDIAATSS